MEGLKQAIKQKVPTKVTFDEFVSDLDKIPTRKDFTDELLSDLFKKKISEKKPIYFMPNTVSASRFGNYEAHIYGCTPDGSKVCVKLTGISIHVDVMSTLMSTDDLKLKLLSEARTYRGDERFDLGIPKIVEQYTLHGFQKTPSKWLRYEFKEFSHRVKFLRFIDDLRIIKNEDGSSKYQLQTANDDAMAKADMYYTVAAATYMFNTGGWNRVENYEVVNDTRCDYTLKVDVSNYTALSSEKLAEITNTRKSPLTTALSNAMMKDPTIVVQWDIETHKELDDGKAPDVDDDYTIINMCSAFFYQHSSIPLLTASVILGDCNVDNTVTLTIVCNDERQLLIANYMLWQHMRVDAMVAFNGASFDWPIYREKLRRNDLIPEFIDAMSVVPDSRVTRCISSKDEHARQSVTSSTIAWSWSSREKIKIDAENDHDLKAVLQVPGIIDLDILPLMLKLYPRAEVPKLESLNFFLKINNIRTKEDMPYKLMSKIYERSRDLRCNNTIKIRPCLDCVSIKSQYMIDDEYTEYIKPELLIDPSKNNKIRLPSGPRDINAIAKLEIVPDEKLLRNLKGYDAFVEQSKKMMTLVGRYCTYDCLLPQELFVKRAIYSDHREVANLPRTGLYEAFYRAGGMKVRNLIRVYSKMFNIGFSNGKNFKKPSEKNHYPGAWVFPPIRGLHTDRPITGMDVASLYPSLKMAYNFSPDMVVKDPKVAEELIKEGYTLHQVGPFNYETGETKGHSDNKKEVGVGWIVRHNGAYKEDSNMRHTYEKQVDNSNGKRNVKYVMVPTTPALVGERMGIFPYIVKMLFAMRVPVKREFVRLTEIVEDMEKNRQDTYNDNGVVYTLSDLIFKLNSVEAKQKAIKLMANTFYGESGNYLSSVFELLVAAGITTAGQATIKSAEEFCRSLGYTTCYGDTDSLYLKCPEEIYKEVDETYNKLRAHADSIENPYEKYRYLVKIKYRYWCNMVDITMKKMKELSEQLSDHMLKFNGTNFINLAYEEVLFPTGLLGKKKYFGNAHVGSANFWFDEDDIDKIVDELIAKNSIVDGKLDEAEILKHMCDPRIKVFVRGIETVKQGRADVVKNIGETVMKRALSIWNNKSMHEIIESMIHNFYKSDIPAQHYSLLGRYKPNKVNVTMHTFYKRMQQAICDGLDPALYTPSEPGDKFRYVVCKKPARWTLSGKKIDIKKGDQMEFMRVYNASQDPTKNIEPLVIDKDFYMKHSIVGILARFIPYYSQYQPSVEYDLDTKDGYESFDKACVGNAAKALIDICDKITGTDKKENFKTGVDYRAIYKNARSHINNIMLEKYGLKVAFVTSSFDPSDNIKDKIDQTLQELQLNAVPTTFAKIDANVINTYDRIHAERVNQYKKEESGTLESVYSWFSQARDPLKKYQEALTRFVESYRVSGRESDMNGIEFYLGIDELDVQLIEEFYDAWVAMTSMYTSKFNTKATQMYLFNERKKRMCIDGL